MKKILTLTILTWLLCYQLFAQQTFTQTVTALNRSGNSNCTILDVADNINPALMIFATPVLVNGVNPNPQSIGAYWMWQNKWSITNMNGAAMPLGAQFNVEYYTAPDANHFVYVTPQQVHSESFAYIDHVGLNNNPNAQIQVFPTNTTTSGARFNRNDVRVAYDASASKWIIANNNNGGMPAGVSYNVMFSGGGNTIAGPVKKIPVISTKDPKTIVKPDTMVVINKPVAQKDIVPQKILTKVYDFSNIHICIDKVSNNNLPPKISVASQAAVPKIKSNGELETVSTISQPLSGVTDLMWSPGESISVGFFSDETFVVTDKVKKYLKEWETYANIKFVFVDDVYKAEVRVGFEKDGTSWSWIGRNVLVNPNDLKTMNLGWLDSHTAETEFRRVVLHEFGHALGFIHEHQAPTAGIPWDKEKVYAFFGAPPNNWDRSMVDNNIFNKYSTTSTNSSTYDPLSIMHYFFPAELTTDGSSFTWNTNLSAVDKTFSRQVYPFPPAPPTATGVLLTGDDCDEIEFTVEYNVVHSSEVEFILEPGKAPNGNIITWWKRIAVPLIGGGEEGLEMQDGHSATKTVQAINIDKARGITFGKAKIAGMHTLLGFKWNVLPAIIGGCRVRLKWRRDGC